MENIKVAKVDEVFYSKISHQALDGTQEPIHGSILITPHHLIFTPVSVDHPQSSPIPSEQQPSALEEIPNHNPSPVKRDAEVWIAHSLFTAVEHLPGCRRPTIIIRLANFSTYTLSFATLNQLEDVWDSLKSVLWSRKPGDKESLFAFVHGVASTSSTPSPQLTLLPGWDQYDPVLEFKRQHALTDPLHSSRNTAWRLSKNNANFNFCSTYPALLLVPAKISDTTLTYAVKYRSKGRLPVASYIHWANGSSITRSSQPMVGFKNARSIQDEKLIEAIFHSHSLHTGPRSSGSQPCTPSSNNKQQTQQVVYGATSSNLIIDARPTTNALANTVKGAGTENMEYYKGCRKAYLGIDNIHVMRDSLNRLVAAIHESHVTGQSVSSEALSKSGWLKHIAAILEGTAIITRTVHVFNSHVLIHCSDGWDRTSQLSALSQVCLDPYYRTFSGFSVLVEKDWLSFGHKFSDRSGIVIPGKERVIFGEPPTMSSNGAHGINTEESEPSMTGGSAWVASFQKQLNFATSGGYSQAYKETSPVFHQFLDCVYQLQKQFPKRFEFNSKYLERLHEELHSGTYGTFLFDCEAERVETKASLRTRSVWELFLPPNDITEYRNPAYEQSLDDPSARDNHDQGVLLPDFRDVCYWWQLFGCDDQAMNSPKNHPLYV